MNFKYKTLSILCVFTAILLWGAGQAPAQSFKLPKYEKFTLENGLTVYLMEQHEVPLVNISIIFPAGAVKDNGLHGLASLTADGLLFGTENHTKKQIEEELDYLGASYYTYAGLEEAGVSMSFVNTDQARVLPILKEIVTVPVFDRNEFDKQKKRKLLRLKQAKEMPRAVISPYYNKFIFGAHVYGSPVNGIRSTVEKITVKDLKTFYQANYKPAASAVAVVGDFETPAMKETLTALFKDWRVKGVPGAAGVSAPPVFNKNRVLLVDKKDAAETQFMIGGPGIRRSNPDYVAVQVVNTVLGGRFTSWLMSELRVNAGLTYGAKSYFNTYKDGGAFVISSYTRTESTVKAIDLALEVMKRLHQEGIDQTTLDSAKNYIKGQFPPQYETGRSLANLLTSMFIYGFDESFIDDFQQNVDSMTLEKTREIIKKYFPGENLQFVLIGKASEIRDQVKKYGEIIEKEIEDDGF
jgi:predicted Zn-dependent peptidase